MIRAFQESDLNTVADIWLETNIQTHHFIPAQYWQEHFELVKTMFLQAEIYVYEGAATHQIQGFLGMQDKYVAGIFVRRETQSHGIGKQLLDFAKSIKPELELHVYQKNERAVQFYQRAAFQMCCEEIDEDTQEVEYRMEWKAD